MSGPEPFDPDSSTLIEAIVDALEDVDVGRGYVPHRLDRDQIEHDIAPVVLAALAKALND